MNLHIKQLPLPLPVVAERGELTTDNARLTLIQLARQHEAKARHYRAAARDIANAIRIDAK